MPKRDFISLRDLKAKEIGQLLSLAERLKKKRSADESLKGKTLALIFEKPSNRTRVSFEVAMTHFGGHTVYLGPNEIKLGVRESVSDVAKVLSRYVDGMVARTYKHEDVLSLSKGSSVPVINGLSNLLHPCQALSDLFTIKEKFGSFSGFKFVFIGDGNNVLHSLMYGASIVGLDMSVVTPKGYEPNREFVKDVMNLAKKSNAKISLSNDAESAVSKADIIYTDVWISMGQEAQEKERLKAFGPFQINEELVKKAKKDVKIMHCMPAHRGQEITDEVLDGPHSIVLDQAENRLHVEKAILYLLLKGEG